jgi:hypothetical protein
MTPAAEYSLECAMRKLKDLEDRGLHIVNPGSD